MKVKNISIKRATPEQVDYLLKMNIVKPGTRSITFVPIEQALNFIKDELNKIGSRRKNEVVGSETKMKVILDGHPPGPFDYSKTMLQPPQNAFDALCLAAEDEYSQQLSFYSNQANFLGHDISTTLRNGVSLERLQTLSEKLKNSAPTQLKVVHTNNNAIQYSSPTLQQQLDTLLQPTIVDINSCSCGNAQGSPRPFCHPSNEQVSFNGTN